MAAKPLASLRYALHHAQKHNLDRIIYIIPYTSIIDQNAEEVRKIYCLDLKEDDNGEFHSCRECSECEKWVLEHHSNLEPEKQSWQDKLLSENWDKPIVFTTMVQFFGCLVRRRYARRAAYPPDDQCGADF